MMELGGGAADGVADVGVTGYRRRPRRDEVVDAFNVKAKVYEKPQDIDSYFDPSFVAEVAKGL